MTDLREIAKCIFLDTLGAIEPASAIRNKLQIEGATLSVAGEQIALNSYSEVVLIGLGKASLKMGAAIEALLGSRVKRGILVTNRRCHVEVRSEVVIAGHPLPDANSLRAAEKITELLRTCGNDTLIIFLISGGGSSLVELPLSQEISLEDMRAANQVLVGCGATIREMNVVRKQLSRVKGGGLGYLARGSKCVGLYVSDVDPDDMLSIASNPLLPEEPAEDALYEVIDKYRLRGRFPRSIGRALDLKTPSHSESERDFVERPLTVLLLDNTSAIQAAATLAGQHGFRVEVDAQSIEGDYRSIADKSIEQLSNLSWSSSNQPVCVISGGEVSCPVRGEGLGGRNQEFVLYSATKLAALGIREAAVLSCGTDGIDGSSNAAGAVADVESIIKAHGDDAWTFINESDSYSFFKKMGGLVVTGPTGNNVRDVRILMAQRT